MASNYQPSGGFYDAYGNSVTPPNYSQVYPNQNYAYPTISQQSTYKPTTFSKSLNTSSIFKNKLFVGIGIAIAIVIGLGLIAAIVMIAIYGAIPCSLTKCNSRASKCVNHPFKAQCICDYGYNGDGINYCDECGLVYSTSNLRIVGGVSSVPYSWPSIAYVQFHYTGTVYISGVGYVSIDQTYACGGTLIDRSTVVTAGHCVPDSIEVKYRSITYQVSITPTASMYKVVLGGYNRSQFGSAPSVVVGCSAVVRNSNFDDSTLQSDIAILKLNQQVSLNNYIQIACLPNPSQLVYPNTSNVDGYIVGWGALSYGGSTPESLQNTKITVYDGSSCSTVSPDTAKDWNSQICAGNIAGGKDTCQGDSGGPLYTKDSVLGNTKYILAGVTSYGDECALVGKPGIYTRVSYFYNWIQDTKFYN